MDLHANSFINFGISGGMALKVGSMPSAIYSEHHYTGSAFLPS